jgi:hypothetical protein
MSASWASGTAPIRSPVFGDVTSIVAELDGETHSPPM